MMSERRLTSSVLPGNKRISGRGSQIGAKVCREMRPLQEKSFQQQETRKLLDFLREKGYENASLTYKNVASVSIHSYFYFCSVPLGNEGVCQYLQLPLQFH